LTTSPLKPGAAAPIDSGYPPPFDRRFLAPRFWPAWLGRGLFRLFSLLPHRARRAVGARIGDLVYARSAKRRAIVLTNLEWCFPELDAQQREAWARGYFRQMAQALCDYGLMWWGSARALERRLMIEGVEHLRTQQAAGRPVILLTCHATALDFGALVLGRHFPAVGMVNNARNPLADWWMARGRTRFGSVLYRRSDGMRPILRAIRAGYAFYYLPDEDLGPENSVFVPFFGVPAATITALSRLARLTGAAVLPYTSYYRESDGRYVARVFPPLEGFPGSDDAADAARMNLALEKLIRLAPEQYMWSLRLFQSRPDGTPPPYAMKGKPGSGPRPRPVP
jgi:lauroyl-KDO2-lipid IV(A) myristoyltransferase